MAAGVNSMYFGIYPDAIMKRYDLSKAWNPATSPPNPLEWFRMNDNEQDRPFALLPVPELNKLFVGTVPGYGKQGGALAEYNLVTGEDTLLHRYSDLSVIALAYKDYRLFAGTSIWGGLGADSTATEAKLIVRNTSNNQMSEFTIPGSSHKRAITDLIAGPDDKIWGLAEGTLFTFNLSTNMIDYHQDLFPVNYNNVNWHVWRDAKMAVNPDGFVYVTIGGKMYRIDPADMSQTLLVSGGAYLLTQDNAGDLYYMSGVNLYKYDK
jgi:hypothetical protein